MIFGINYSITEVSKSCEVNMIDYDVEL